MTSTKQRAKTVISLAILTIFFGIATGAFQAKADEPCKTPEALAHLANVKKNQPRIAENRDARDRVAAAFNAEAEISPDDVDGYNEFVRNKAWNESENDALHKLGCQIDWKTLELVSFKPGAVSPEKLHNATTAPSKVTWTLPGGTEHQQHVMKRCQEKLIEKGVTAPEALKYGCSIYLAENERMDPLRLGDGGHAFGICQRNLGKVWAQTFMDNNPEWKTLETQLEYCTARFAAAYQRYGNVFQATVEHNCPACARRNKDACHINPCYFERVKLKTSLLQAL